MKCTEIEKQINSFIDDESDAPLSSKVENHLKECRACEQTFESLQIIRRTISKDVSVSASSQLDERVSEAFMRHHENKQKNHWRAFVFGQIAVSRLSFAAILLALIVFTGSAFQAGKMLAIDVSTEISATEKIKVSPLISNADLPVKAVNESENKITNPQVIKYIEVPVVKEKIVTRVIYVKKQTGKENTAKIDSAKSIANNFALNSSVNENRYATQVNLKEFQPISEMKIEIIRKDENNEE